MDEITFEPSVLKWARERRFGPKPEILSENIPSSLGITIEDILKWESGDSQPTTSQVRTLSKLYKRAFAVFFLTSPPQEDLPPPDYRTIGSKDNVDVSPAALLAFRKARIAQSNARVLFEEIGETYSFKYPKYPLSEDPIRLASAMRSELNITIDQQFRFSKYEDFFEYLRERLETTGILTRKSGSTDSFSLKDCRAFSLTDKVPYLIVINNKDTQGGKIFSLMHEFAHVLIRRSGICNDYSIADAKKSNSIEAFCNKFAGNFLVPEASFLGLVDTSAIEHLDEQISNAARLYKVGRFVILRRMRDLGEISESLYKSKVRAWEEEPIPTKKRKGRFSLKTHLKMNGKRYSSLVFEAYRNRKISSSRASEYLGIKSKHLSNFERLIS